MKIFLINIVLILTIYSARSSETFYQISQDDVSEVNKLYENLNGENWVNSDGWPVSSGTFSVDYLPDGIRVELGDVIYFDQSSSITLYAGNVSEIDLSGNNLRGFVPVLEMENLKKLDVSSNSFSFEHLELNAGLIENYIYSPQDTVYKLDIIGNTATVLVGGQQLIYDWFVNDELKTGTNSPEYRINPNEIIKCRVTSLLLPGLELWSEEFGEIIEQKDTLYRISSSEVDEINKLYDSLDGMNWKNTDGWPLEKVDFYKNKIFAGLVIEFTSNVVYEDKYKIVYEAFVSEILLYSYDLSGITPNLSLPKLRILRLSSNFLFGAIPNFDMPNLEKLILFSSQLTGIMPNFNMPKLTYLNLADNQLKYDIPQLNLPNLEYLNLSNNRLMSYLPDFIMPKLTYLNLSNNRLRGRIPYFIMPLLEFMDLSDNRLSERIPDFNMPGLSFLDLSYNELSREIPDFDMPYLKMMDLSNNQLTGEIPDFRMDSLNNLLLGNNQLSGEIPDFDMDSLWFLYLSNNQLTGAIPDFNMPLLVWLYVDNNLLSGEIPDFNLPNLRELFLFENMFTFEVLEVNASKTYSYKYAPQDTILPIERIDNKIFVTVDGSANSYKWFLDSNEVQTTNVNYYIPSEDGIYYCEVRSSLLPGLTLSSGTISVTNTGIETHGNDVKIIQTNEQINISTNGKYFGSEMKIFNNIGEIIYSGKMLNRDESVDVSGFMTGGYNFVLMKNNQIIKSRKFVIMN